MTRNTLYADAAIALVLAILVIVISPGLAVVGLLALLVVLICAVSFWVDRRRRRRHQNPLAEFRRTRRAASRPARERPASRREPRRR